MYLEQINDDIENENPSIKEIAISIKMLAIQLQRDEKLDTEEALYRVIKDYKFPKDLEEYFRRRYSLQIEDATDQEIISLLDAYSYLPRKLQIQKIMDRLKRRTSPQNILRILKNRP
jgi:hypothetical protein